MGATGLIFCRNMVNYAKKYALHGKSIGIHKTIETYCSFA